MLLDCEHSACNKAFRLSNTASCFYVFAVTLSNNFVKIFHRSMRCMQTQNIIQAMLSVCLSVGVMYCITTVENTIELILELLAVSL